ncbi:MAG: type II toxin-antitoxin system VapC family toxin [Actinobacteria bacterium]|nr:type II toxin-antitoxin system VapC family toxin [Actinomycetota bacterium]
MATNAPRLVYLDSSAILKLVVRETETDALARYLGQAQTIASEIASIEVPRAAYLKTGAEETVSRAEELLRYFHLLELDDELQREAARARPSELRTLDALHLVSALRVRDEIDAVVAYDRRLGEAARAAGLRVDAPGAGEC